MPKYIATVIIQTDQSELEGQLLADLSFLIESSLDVHKEMSDEVEFKTLVNIASINVEEVKRI